MKQTSIKKIVCWLCVFAVLPALTLAAQNKNKFSAMSLTGITGLYVVPTARLGWEDANMGLNGGYHANFADDGELKNNHLLQYNMSFFRLFEAAGTFDIQPYTDDNDLLMGVKFKLPVAATNIAFGGNVHYNDFGETGDHFGFQLYGVVTYGAEFFGMPSETSLFIGKSFFQGQKADTNIDFGMGFDLIVLPKYLQNFVHWIIDFSNYSYTVSSKSSGSWIMNPSRGILNTGLRLDLSQIPVLSNFNFVIDAYLADAFDARGSGFGRTFGFGAVFGLKF